MSKNTRNELRNMEKAIVHAHIKVPADLWKEFMVFSRINSTTASKLIRNYVRKTLNKPNSEMEK